MWVGESRAGKPGMLLVLRTPARETASQAMGANSGGKALIVFNLLGALRAPLRVRGAIMMAIHVVIFLTGPEANLKPDPTGTAENFCEKASIVYNQ